MLTTRNIRVRMPQLLCNNDGPRCPPEYYCRGVPAPAMEKVRIRPECVFVCVHVCSLFMFVRTMNHGWMDGWQIPLSALCAVWRIGSNRLVLHYTMDRSQSTHLGKYFPLFLFRRFARG